ncbi:hypothetical protein AUC31_06735 [Planococcus rifietoensis]|uniref:Uncharacterized protein n=1 Tax=Planococcus rifietoensis TaxID=200991 RepID=A0A0U2Z4Z3_9BACL|nr:hypothetical protein AUC31_06735 [Planococcus rifietoensis]
MRAPSSMGNWLVRESGVQLGDFFSVYYSNYTYLDVPVGDVALCQTFTNPASIDILSEKRAFSICAWKRG